MKKKIITSVVALITLSMAACAPTAPVNPSPVTNVTNTTPSAPVNYAAQIQASLPYIQTAAGIATGAALNFAIKDATERTTVANQIWAASQAVYSLTNGQVPTVQQLQTAILSFGGSQTDANYANFASSITAIYASYYNKLSGNGQLAVQVLNALASGAQTGASTFQTVTTSSTVAPVITVPVATPAPVVSTSNSTTSNQ